MNNVVIYTLGIHTLAICIPGLCKQTQNTNIYTYKCK